jgi:hypothetical protein
MASVASRTIEFHRYGEPEGILSPTTTYIRIAGRDSGAQDVSPSLKQARLEEYLSMLRYAEENATTRQEAEAEERLGAEAALFLDNLQPLADQLLQLDLVCNAAELWAFPFEAAYGHFPTWLQGEDSGVVITRRLRGDYSDQTNPWPVQPRVLFLHAPAAPDLESTLIEGHALALKAALAPWTKGKDAVASGLLEIREVSSASEIGTYRKSFKPVYIHVLAHGAPTASEQFRRDKVTWGLRLGDPGRPGVPPNLVAEKLQPDDGLPVVVTLAACDTGNQADTVFAERSVAQELHRCGVPVVIGSQLPFTKVGSRTFTQTFYQRLLQAEDVRAALHAARLSLKADKEAGHDWLSLVGYVRLPPEGYAAYLDEVGLRVELRLLEAAYARADRLSAAGGGERSAFASAEQDVRARLQSLKARKQRLANRKDLLDECCGLEASAYKRLAELLFIRGLQHPGQRDADWAASREALTASLDAYRTSYESDLRSHWLGVQQLALDAVLNRQSHADDWAMVQRSAETARDVAIRKGPDVPQGQEAYWAYGTLTELALLDPAPDRKRNIDRAKTFAAQLVASAQKAGETFPIQSTRRQLNRYVRWWTREHGFFASGEDLSAGAGEILAVLPER